MESLKEIEKQFDRVSAESSFSEELAYTIWCAVVTTTKAFGKVTLKIDTNTDRIFITIELRWWAKHKRMEILKKYWLAKAERRAEKFIPEGWKSLIYYQSPLASCAR